MTSSISSNAIIKGLDKSQNEMYRLQQQSLLHSQKEKKKYQPYINYNKDTSFDANIMDGLINKEIDKMHISKGWKSLPKSVKWEKIQEYYQQDSIKDMMTSEQVQCQKEKIKIAILSNKQIDINYNTKDKTIISIPDIY